MICNEEVTERQHRGPDKKLSVIREKLVSSRIIWVNPCLLTTIKQLKYKPLINITVCSKTGYILGEVNLIYHYNVPKYSSHLSWTDGF